MASDLPMMIVGYVCFLFSLSIHEAAHAAMADRCGDPSARLLGRATLNPLAHIDPIGTVLMPLLMMFSHLPFLFGWAKPVPFNPRNLHDIRRDPVFIAIAGPVSNLLLAFLFVFISRILIVTIGTIELPFLLGFFLYYMIVINLVLAVFNIIPVPPLDGHHVLYYFLPPSGQQILERIGPFGIIIAIFAAKPVFKIAFSVFIDPVLSFAGLSM